MLAAGMAARTRPTIATFYGLFLLDSVIKDGFLRRGLVFVDGVIPIILSSSSISSTTRLMRTAMFRLIRASLPLNSIVRVAVSNLTGLGRALRSTLTLTTNFFGSNGSSRVREPLAERV